MVSTQDLTQHVRTILDRDPMARLIAFDDPGTSALTLPAEGLVEAVGNAHYRALRTGSELAMRAAIVRFARDPESADVLVLLTPLKTEDLSADLRYKLSKNKIFRIDPWEAIRATFGARGVAPSLREREGLGKALLRSTSTTNYAPLASNILTEDEAWRRLMTQEYGFAGELGDVQAWLEWTLRQREAMKRFFEDEPLIEDARLLFEERLGQLGIFLHERLLEDRDATHPGINLLLGALAMRALDAASKDEAMVALASQVRGALPGALGWKGGLSLTTRLAEVAGPLARIYANMEREEPELTSHVALRLDELFAQMEATELSIYSRASKLGWFALLEQFAQALDHDDALELARAMEAITRHDEFSAGSPTHRHLQMLHRLWFYLHHRPTGMRISAERGVADIARHYIEHGSFLDWCRLDLTTSTLDERLHAAATRLLQRASTERDALAKIFAQDASRKLEQGAATLSPDVLSIQHVMERAVAPIAQHHNVLLIVLDGLSWGVARELLADPELESAWTPMIPGTPHGATLPMCALLPTVTALSRSALLTGRIEKGTQKSERLGFASHPALQPKKKNAFRPPVLFHKKELGQGGPGAVSEEVASALRDATQRVVGVVINTIDDQLSGAEQMHHTWSVESIAPLRALLDLAISTERLVILASDHGHIWEDRSHVPEGVKGTHGRYRLDSNGKLAEGEVVIKGITPRILVGQDEVVVPYGERLRYSSPHRGYHGGASIQEVVTPLIALLHDGISLDASIQETWRELIDAPPSWWRLEEEREEVSWESTPGEAASSQTAPTPQDTPNTPQLDMFTPLQQEPTSLAEESSESKSYRTMDETIVERVEQLLNSPLYQIQANKNRALATAQQSAFRILCLLFERQSDGVSVEEIAQHIQQAGSKTRRLLITMQRALNIDGYDIFRYDREDARVTLDVALLEAQFMN